MANVLLLAGLGFGDEGKGATCDFLCRKNSPDPTLVVRYGGGPQAAHNVVTPDGRHHTFSQFGSGTFVPGTRTLLSRHMLVNPINMLAEERHLRALGVTDAFDRMLIEREALVVNPFQIAANRLRELARGVHRHGSCGQGVGEAKYDLIATPETAINMGTVEEPGILRAKLDLCRQHKLGEFERVVRDLPRTEAVAREWHLLRDEGAVDACVERLREVYRRVRVVDHHYLQPELMTRRQLVVFEGAQGVLLDHAFGFFPYVTHGDTTFKNALDLMPDYYRDFRETIVKYGILRAYSTRHGAGPFPTEDPDLKLPEPHNGNGPWQQGFRVGPLDLVLARYAVDVLRGVDGLVLNHLDHLGPSGAPQWLCVSYHTQMSHPRLICHATRQAHKIEPHWSHSLGDRKTLTDAMWRATPAYRRFQTRREWAQVIENTLGASIIIEGHGPTSDDRHHRRQSVARISSQNSVGIGG